MVTGDPRTQRLARDEGVAQVGKGQFWGIAAVITMMAVAGCGNTADPSHHINESAKKAISDTKKVGNTVDKNAKKGIIGGTKSDTSNNIGKSTKSNSGSKSKSSSSVVHPGSVSAGSKLFASTCQACHGKGGVGSSTAPRLAKSSTVISQFGTQVALEAFIAHNMPASKPGSLTPQQASNAAAYVWQIASK